MIYAAKLCPRGTEASMFALFMGLSNFGRTAGEYLGSFLLQAYGGVEAPVFENLEAFVVTACLMQAIPILMVPYLVPRGSPRGTAQEMGASRAIFGDGQDGMPPEITSCCRDDIELMRGVSSSSSSGPGIRSGIRSGIRGASAVPAGSGQLLVATPLSPFDHDLPVGTVTLVNPLVNPLVKPLVKPPVVAVAEVEAVGEVPEVPVPPVQPASVVIPMPSADLETLLAKAREEERDIHRDRLETLLTQARQEAREAAAAAAQIVARQTMEAQSQMLALIAEQHALLLKAVGESTSKLSQRLDSLEEAPSRAPGTTPATPAAPSEALPWALGDRSVSVAEAASVTVSDGSGGGGGEGGSGGDRSRGGGRSGSTAADVHPVWSDIFMPDDAR